MAEIEEFLKKREAEGLLRTLRPISTRRQGRMYHRGTEYIDFSSNDYLGLAEHPKIVESARDMLDRFGASASASRLMSGDLDICHCLEDAVAGFKHKEAALVFNSGYQANTGIISALYSRNDCIFSDRLNHASIIDGILLSGAALYRFAHNDTGHLESLLKKERSKFKKALIITESVFSMDGDRAPLQEIAELKGRYGCELMVDEAHATGIFGSNGSGVVEEAGVSDSVDLIMGTFGKALGSFGAYLASSRKTIDYLVNTCRSFIYSTALPPSVIAANTTALEIVCEEPHRRKILLERAAYFRSALQAKGFETRGESQIVPVMIGENKKTLDLAAKLQGRGYWVLAVRPPTVPHGQARLRFSLTCHHDKNTLQRIADDLAEVSI